MGLTESRTIYIYPSRGNGKTYITHKMIEAYLEAGYEVKFIEPKLTNQRGFTLAPAIIDKDILTPAQCERAERILNDILKGGTK